MKTPFLERLGAVLSPSWFFAGIALGMTLCIAAGHWAARQGTYTERPRFFCKLSPEGAIYPTLDNLCEYVRHRAPRDKVLVLVCGSSISLGCGQKNALLWTNRLQERLGPGFAVVNVAFRSCFFASVGVPLAEILSREYPRWYLVSDLAFTNAPSWLFDPKGVYPYRYLLWQGRAEGLLQPNAQRDEELKSVLFSKDEAIRHCAEEDALRALLEREFKACSLWNWIGDYHFFPVYSLLLSPRVPFWTPRERLIDDESDAVPMPERMDRIREHELALLRATMHGVGNTDPAQRFSSFKTHPVYAETLGKMVSDPAFRAHMLFLLNTKCPYFIERLDNEERSRYLQSIHDDAASLNALGLRTIPIGLGYNTEDYWDLSHFSNSAAPKMAAEVSAKLLDMARRDGIPFKSTAAPRHAQ
ncbi:MAG: hypothetical protein ACFUZC_13130 [Chthoniobacteraceae bacterium]